MAFEKEKKEGRGMGRSEGSGTVSREGSEGREGCGMAGKEAGDGSGLNAGSCRDGKGSELAFFSVAFWAMASWIRLFIKQCFFFCEDMGLLDYQDPLFLSMCLAIFIGTLSVHWLIRRPACREKPSAWYMACALAAAASTFLSDFVSGFAAIGVIAAGLLAGGNCLGFLMNQLTDRVPLKKIGVFMGLGYAVTSLCVIGLFAYPWLESQLAFTAILGSIPLLGILFFRKGRPVEGDSDDVIFMPDRRLVMQVICTTILYALIAGLIDNLLYFEEALNATPGLVAINFGMTLLTDILFALLFFKLQYTRVITASIAMICVGQALTLFAGIHALAVPYLVFTAFGVSALEMYIITMPVLFAKKTGKRGMLPSLGYLIPYGAFFAATLLYMLLPIRSSAIIIGIILILQIIVLMLAFNFMTNYQNQQVEAARASASITHDSGGGPQPPAIAEMIKAYKLTNRETQVLYYLLGGASTPDIAAKMVVTEKTVQNYISSMLAKTGKNNRMEMAAFFRHDAINL